MKRSREHSPDTPPQATQSTSSCITPGIPAGGGRGGKSKMIQDRLHGQVKLEPLLVRVLDTPEYQRLAEIKQLGGTVYVYPSANHSRKEHSIGVCHLAGMAVTHLRDHQPELGISEDDIQCVKLAGLVHDIGHGPFSHMFEEFIHRHGRQLAAAGDAASAQQFLDWTHESVCAPILERLIEANQITLADFFAADEDDPDCRRRLRFVVALVNGLNDDAVWPPELSPKLKAKRFLFDIVNNKRNGIDVDKLDYLARDALAAFGSSNPPGFDILRIIRASKVVRGMVCYEEKVTQDIKKVFDMRSEQHQALYQHRVVNAVETMITDVLAAANRTFQFRGADGKPMRLTDAVTEASCASYVLLNDSVVEQISVSLAPDLDEARELVRRLKSREYYQRVGESVKLRMLPRCEHCGGDTEILDQFCRQCAASTASRQRFPVLGKNGQPRHDGLCQSEHASLTEEGVRREILGLCEPALTEEQAASFYVSIIEIFHGKLHPQRDAHGHLWIAHDPLARVGFFNPREEEPHSLKCFGRGSGGLQGIFRTAETALRTLHCYCKHDDPDAAEALEGALAKWRDKRGAHAQQGTANPTPSHTGTPRRNTAAAERQQAPGSGPRPMPALLDA